MGHPNDYYDYKSLDDRRFYDDVQLCALCGTWVQKENVRMFNVEFEPVVGELKRSYSGQHQGGRVSSQGETEIQN